MFTVLRYSKIDRKDSLRLLLLEGVICLPNQAGHLIREQNFLLTYKALHGLASYYLCNLLLPYSPPCSLRSSDSCLLIVPRYRLSSMGGRSFSVVAPKLWNSLPRSLCLANNLSEFKSLLKTHLFSECYLS